MRIVFFGTTDFGIPSLERLVEKHEVVLVITQPDKPHGRKKIMTAPQIKLWSGIHKIETIQPEKLSEIEEKIQSVKPDMIITASYGKIIPEKILNIPRLKSVNIHPSLLPKYRGPSPIQTAIINDEKQTGISIMLMDSQLDHGPILAQKAVDVSEADNYESLHAKLAEQSAALLTETVEQYSEGKIVPKEQNHELATFTKLLTRNDARLDWTMPARQLLQIIKALNPNPGTWTTLDGKSVKIIQAEEYKSGSIDLPGKIFTQDKNVLVKCKDYSLKLLLVQPDGKQPLSGTDFLNGLKNIETKIFR